MAVDTTAGKPENLRQRRSRPGDRGGAAHQLSRSVKTMKLLISFIALLSVNASGSEWSIRWEAAKGATVCTIPYDPRPLEAILSALPAGHPEANADIKKGLKPATSTTELLGMFNGRKVMAAELEVPQTYYSRYFLIVAEVEDGKFMPIYIHQFAPGAHGHGMPTFKASESDFSVTVTSKTIGTDPSEETFRITCDLKSPPRTEQDADDQLPARAESKAQ